MSAYVRIRTGVGMRGIQGETLCPYSWGHTNVEEGAPFWTRGAWMVNTPGEGQQLGRRLSSHAAQVRPGAALGFGSQLPPSFSVSMLSSGLVMWALSSILLDTCPFLIRLNYVFNYPSFKINNGIHITEQLFNSHIQCSKSSLGLNKGSAGYRLYQLRKF